MLAKGVPVASSGCGGTGLKGEPLFLMTHDIPLAGCMPLPVCSLPVIRPNIFFLFSNQNVFLPRDL